MNKLILCLLLSTSAFAQFSMTGKGSDQKIAVQNSILAKVNGTNISMIDVKKKMDVLFHQHYPQLADNTQARFQFYDTSWRRVLSEMIDNELILADAADKEIKITDGEIREEIESRFGPSVMSTLDRINLTYDEAWKLIKNEMIVQRMSWWFIQSKAISNVSPGQIRQAYKTYLKENPPYSQWKYRVLTIRGCETPETPEQLYKAINGASIDELAARLKQFEAEHPNCTTSLSTEYVAIDSELAESHKTALAELTPGQYGQPESQITRDKKKVYRIFYLSDKIAHAATSFEDRAPLIKNELLQKASADVAQSYLGKLRKHYRFDSEHIKESVPADLHPFSLQ